MVARLILQESEPVRYHLQEDASFQSVDADQLRPGRIWRVCVIREGWSKNKRYYPRDVLMATVPLLEGASVALYACTHTGAAADHLARPARIEGEAPAGNVAGLTANVAFEESGPEGPGIYADFHVSSEDVRRLALASREAGVPCPLGLSIDATGMGEMGFAEGRQGLIVREIVEILETTLVSNPAAGGRLLRLVASTGKEEENSMNGLRRFLERRLRRTNGNADAVAGMAPQALAEAVAAQFQEMDGDKAILGLALDFLKAGKTEEAIMALEKLVTTVDSEPSAEPAMEAKKKPMMEAVAYASSADVSAQAQRLSQLERNLQESQCALTLRESLAASGLPDEVQSYVRKQFAGKVFTSVELAEAITDARNMLAKALPAGGIQTTTRTSVGVEPYDRLAAAIDLMWDGSVPEGIQESEAHRQAKRGGVPRIREIATQWYDDHQASGRPGANRVLVEATTADLAALLGTSLNRRVSQEFMARAREYERWVTINSDVTDFKLQTILVEGSLGALPTVAQGDGVGTATYAYGVLGSDDSVTASITKYGKVWGITREVIKNDDMRWLRNLPRQMANSALLTEKQQVMLGLIGNLGAAGINTDTCYTGNVLYAGGHNNYATTAFSYAGLVAALKMKRNARLRGCKTTITSNINSSTTTIPVASTKNFAAGGHFYIDNELFTIVTVDSATQFTSAARSGADAASHTSGAAVRQLTDQMVLSQHTLVVPTDLVDTAAEVLASVLKPDTANNNGSALPYLARDIVLQDYHSSFLGNDANNWYMPVSAKEGEFLTLAHMDGQRTPYVGVAEGQEAFNMLHADQTDYKARFEFLVKQVQPDGSTGNIVA